MRTSPHIVDHTHCHAHPPQTDVESDTEEDEYESDVESAELLMEDTTYHTPSRRSRELARRSKGDAEEDEMFDPHSAKFRAEGQLMNYEDDPSFEGYLTVRVGLVESHAHCDAQPSMGLAHTSTLYLD